MNGGGFPPRRRKDRNGCMKTRIIILGSIIALVVAGWAVAWFVIAGMIRQNVEVMAANDGVTAPRLVCSRIDIGGFPFRFDLGCSEAEITSGDLTVALPLVEATARVYAPTHLIARATGPATLADSFTGARNEIGWDSLDASIRLDNWRIARASLVGANLAWADTLLTPTELARAEALELHLMDMPEAHDPERRLASLAAYGRAGGLDAPSLAVSEGAAELQLELTGLPDDIRNWGDPLLLQTLANNGAQLRVVSVTANDVSSELTASGDLALDQSGLVNGRIDIVSNGVAERIGPMIEEPWRTLVLGVPGADGRHTNQINFAGGVVSSGLVPITAIPPLF